MKKFLLITIVFICSASVIFCQKVDPVTAMKIATKVYAKRHPDKDVKANNIIPIGNTNDTLFYIVPISDQGFVIISADRAAPPILGQCSTGIYDAKLLPPGLLYLFEKYKYAISELKKAKIAPSKKVESQWKEVLSPQYGTSKSYTISDVLLHTEWGQQSGFNYYCPPNCPAGCTAVAMAQILRYWECRVVGQLNDYMWVDMSDIWADLDNAQLIHDAGLSCDTDYDPDGSSSTPGKARDGFVDYFGISSSAEVKWRFWHLNYWQDMLEDEIDLERPILYSGAALLGGGHSWVLDGYDEYENFHCNWGWYGDYNDFYSLGDFDPGGNGPFNQYESAIFNVVPNQSSGVGIPQISAQTVTYNGNGNSISVPETFGATSYEWSTQYGTISGTSRIATLYSDYTTNVQVRAYNNRCNIYSSYNSSAISVDYGPITGSYVICSTGSEYTVTNVPSGSTITWSNGQYLNRTSSQGSNPCSFESTGSGNSWIGAQVTTPYGSRNVTNFSVCSGIPIVSYIEGPNGPIGPQNNFYAHPSPDYESGVSYTWYLGPSGSLYYWMDHAEATLYESGSYAIGAYATNSCGSSGYALAYFDYYDYDYVISPNPASSEVTITLRSNKSLEQVNSLSNNPVYNVTIINSNGVLFGQYKRSGSSFTLPINSLKNGNYYIKISNGKSESVKQLIVKH